MCESQPITVGKGAGSSEELFVPPDQDGCGRREVPRGRRPVFDSLKTCCRKRSCRQCCCRTVAVWGTAWLVEMDVLRQS